MSHTAGVTGPPAKKLRQYLLSFDRHSTASPSSKY